MCVCTCVHSNWSACHARPTTVEVAAVAPAHRPVCGRPTTGHCFDVHLCLIQQLQHNGSSSSSPSWLVSTDWPVCTRMQKKRVRGQAGIHTPYTTSACAGVWLQNKKGVSSSDEFIHVSIHEIQRDARACMDGMVVSVHTSRATARFRVCKKMHA